MSKERQDPQPSKIKLAGVVWTEQNGSFTTIISKWLRIHFTRYQDGYKISLDGDFVLAQRPNTKEEAAHIAVRFALNYITMAKDALENAIKQDKAEMEGQITCR